MPTTSIIAKAKSKVWGRKNAKNAPIIEERPEDRFGGE
jgi:hypothetical protein